MFQVWLRYLYCNLPVDVLLKAGLWASRLVFAVLEFLGIDQTLGRFRESLSFMALASTLPAAISAKSSTC